MRETQGGEDHRLPGPFAQGAGKVLGCQADGSQQQAHPEQVGSQAAGEYAFARGMWWPFHGIRVGSLDPQSKGRQAIGDQVDPQELNGSEGDGHPQQRSHQHDKDLADVARDDVAHELADVLIYGAPLLDGVHDGGKVVIQQHHVGGLFAHVCAGDAHGHSDVGALERWSIVDPVAGHGHEVSPALERLDDLDLVFRAYAGIDRHVFHNRLQIIDGHDGQLLPADHRRASGAFRHDLQLASNVKSCKRVVAGDHHHPNASGAALGHRLTHFGPGRIDHAGQPNEDQIAFQSVLIAVSGRRIERSESNAQHAHAIIGQAVVGRCDPAAPIAVQRG